MFRLFRACLLVLFFISTTTVANSETSWITKKSDKTEKEIKKEKKDKAEYIKKKEKEIKKNKAEFKKEEKKISKEVKSWITKKTKEKYIDSIDKLPDGAIYFTGFSSISGLNFYGYVVPDTKSKLISNYYETSTGFGYFSDSKTICKLGSTVLIVLDNEVTARVSGNCNNGLKFTGKTTQTLNSGWGSAKTDDGKDRFNFDFNINKTLIAKIFDINNQIIFTGGQNPLPESDIKVNPEGKYYALLIGNTKYAKWASLKSPVNDVNEIAKVLKKKYDFEKIVTKINVSRSDIFKSFKQMKELVTDNDYLLIYYAGHGEKETQRAYWIPVDGDKEWDENWIDTATITAAIQRIRARHILLMIDSCYLGSSFKGNKSDINKSESDWNAEEAIKGLNNRAGLVMASGGETPVIDTAIDDKHSLFAYKFLDILNKNEDFITSSNVFLKIKKYHATQKQVPQFYGVANWGHLDGDFVFKVRN